MKKKVLTTALACGLLLCLASGCSNTDEQKETSAPQTETTQDAGKVKETEGKDAPSSNQETPEAGPESGDFEEGEL